MSKYNQPKLNWDETSVPSADDFNRIEGNIDYLESGKVDKPANGVATLDANGNVVQKAACIAPLKFTGGVTESFDGSATKTITIPTKLPTPYKLKIGTRFFDGNEYVSIVKGDLGLGNVNDTADNDKPVSNAQKAALAAKVDNSQLGANNGVATLDGNGNVRQKAACIAPLKFADGVKESFDGSKTVTIDKRYVGLENVDNTADVNQTKHGTQGLTTQDLNSYNNTAYVGWYFGTGDNTVLHKPDNVKAFSLEVLRSGANGFIQRLIDHNAKSTYTRTFQNNTWTSWVHMSNERTCVCGLDSNDATARYFKVASAVSNAGGYDHLHAKFDVYDVDSGLQGKLEVICNTGVNTNPNPTGDIKVTNVFTTQASVPAEFLERFVLAYKANSDGTATFEIWLHTSAIFSQTIFKLTSEFSRKTAEPIWTLYNNNTVASASTIPAGYTQKVNTGTFAINGHANTAVVSSKLGIANVGNDSTPIYLKAGVPMPCTSAGGENGNAPANLYQYTLCFSNEICAYANMPSAWTTVLSQKNVDEQIFLRSVTDLAELIPPNKYFQASGANNAKVPIDSFKYDTSKITLMGRNNGCDDPSYQENFLFSNGFGFGIMSKLTIY